MPVLQASFTSRLSHPRLLACHLCSAGMIRRKTQEGATYMSDHNEKAAVAATSGQIPTRVRLFSPILKFLLVAGIPMGPNRLVTIRGRKSGLPRTTPLAIVEVGGRRWVWAPWGEVQWVRNLRAAGRATLSVRAGKKKSRDRARPDGARWVLPRRTRSARAQHSVRCPVHPHRRRCRSQRSGGSGRGSAGLRTPPRAMMSTAEPADWTRAGWAIGGPTCRRHWPLRRG